MPEDRDYVTVMEAADLLGLAAGSVYVQIRNKRIPAVKNRYGALLIARRDVDAYQQQRRGQHGGVGNPKLPEFFVPVEEPDRGQ